MERSTKMNRRKRMRRTNSIGGRRVEDSVFKPDNSESMASLALVGVFIMLTTVFLLVRYLS